MEAFPDLLKEGLEVYNNLKNDLEQALGLKQYAENLSKIVELFKDVNQHLDDNEKAIQEKLKIAHRLTKEGLEKARLVVTVIKEQSNVLVSVLDPSAAGTDHDKMWAACQYFSDFAKNIEGKVKEAEDALRQASNVLDDSQMDLGSIVRTLERVQNKFLDEKKKAKKKKKKKGLLKTAAVVTAGFVTGGLAVAAFGGIAAAIEHGMSIHDVEKKFRQQRDKIRGYIRSFGSMLTETKALLQQLNSKRQQLNDIHAKLSVTGTLAGIKLESLPLTHFKIIRANAKDLVEACEKFLQQD